MGIFLFFSGSPSPLTALKLGQHPSLVLKFCYVMSASGMTRQWYLKPTGKPIMYRFHAVCKEINETRRDS